MYVPLHLFVVLSVCYAAACGAPVSGVAEFNLIVNCSGRVEIPITKNCWNEFIIEGKTMAEGKGTKFFAQEPFEFDPAKGMMLVKAYMDVTHHIICDDGELWEEKRFHYKMTPNN